MLVESWIMLAALDREVERDLETMFVRCRDEGPQIPNRGEFGMDRVVPALGRADRIGAARIVRARGRAIVVAFAIGSADRGIGGRESASKPRSRIPSRRRITSAKVPSRIGSAK
jgi:hypothetical protein